MTSIPATVQAKPRIAWVDVAKGIGIVLVFHGHLVEQFSNAGLSAAASQFRWIYSFHMPMFFLLVGCVYKEKDLSFEVFIKHQILTRLIPVWVFNLLAVFIWLAIELTRGAAGWVAEHGWLALAKSCGLETLFMVLLGRPIGAPDFRLGTLSGPVGNFLTWFIICLFTVELVQFLLRKKVRGTAALACSVVGFGLLTIFVAFCKDALVDIYGEKIHAWRIASAVTAMFFYQLGILLGRLGLLRDFKSKLYPLGLALLCLLITLVTFNRNINVLMAGAQYGNIGWFFATSIAGSLFVIYVSQILAAGRLLTYIGQITLSLMCLDGILHEFVNPGLAGLTARLLPEPNAVLSIAAGLLCTLLSLAVCLPVTWFLQRYLPFTLGRGMSHPDVSARSVKPA